MPYVSSAQQRFMHAVHPDIAERWDKETDWSKKLPRKLRKKKSVVREGFYMRPAFQAILEAVEYWKNPQGLVVGVKSKTWYNKLGIGDKKRRARNTAFLKTYGASTFQGGRPATRQEYDVSQKQRDVNYYKGHPEVGHPKLMYKSGVWEKMGK